MAARRPEKRRTGEDTFWRERGQKTRGGVGCPPPPNRGDRRGGPITRSWREGRPRVQYDRREVSVLDYSRAKQGGESFAAARRSSAPGESREYKPAPTTPPRSPLTNRSAAISNTGPQERECETLAATGMARQAQRLGSAERQDRALLTAAKLVARLLPERNHYLAAVARTRRQSGARGARRGPRTQQPPRSLVARLLPSEIIPGLLS